MCSFDVHLWLKIMNSDAIALESEDKETHQGQRMHDLGPTLQRERAVAESRLKSDTVAQVA